MKLTKNKIPKIKDLILINTTWEEKNNQFIKTVVYNKKEEVIDDPPPKGVTVGLTNEDKKWMLDNFTTKAELKSEINNINKRLDNLVIKNELKE